MEDQVSCMNILKSNPKFMHAKNIRQLTAAFLEMAINKGIEGQNFLKGLAQTTNSPAITQCANFDYDGVVGSFRSALGELKEDPLTASYDAKVAGDGPETCDRGLASEHIVNPQIIALNKQILLLSKIAFLLTDKL
ncbi:Pla a 1-like [Sesbania bispinosa]|nr:Pla a 1-like [Sesbania bispinosa]